MCLHYIKYEKWTSSAKGLFKILGEIWPEYLAVPPGPEERFRGASLSSSQHFSYSWARAVSDKLCLSSSGTKSSLGFWHCQSERAFGPKTRRCRRVGRRREVFVYSSPRHRALSINQPSLRCLAAGMAFFSSNFSFCLWERSTWKSLSGN